MSGYVNKDRGRWSAGASGLAGVAQRGVRVATAVADFTAEDHRRALAYAAPTCAVTLTTDRVVAALAGCGERPPTRTLYDPVAQFGYAARDRPRRARCVVRVRCIGTPSHQALRRMKLSATAAKMCSRWTLSMPA